MTRCWRSWRLCVLPSRNLTRSTCLWSRKASIRTTDSERFESVLADALESELITDAAIARSESERQTFWAIRDGVGEITPALSPFAALDVSMDIAAMPRFLDAFDKALAAALPDSQNLVFGHLGDNNLHLFVTTGHEAENDKVYELAYGFVGECGGSISAEHGVGSLKCDFLHLSRSPQEIQLMGRLNTGARSARNPQSRPGDPGVMKRRSGLSIRFCRPDACACYWKQS